LDACESNQADRKIFSYTKLAQIQNIQCDFAGAEENLVQSFKHIENSKNKEYIQNMYNELGKTFEEQANYEDALIYYKKSLKDNQNPLYENIIKNNIAVVYIEKKEPEKAITILKPLLKDKVLIENPIYLAKIIDNLGFAYFKNNNDSLGKRYLETSLKIRDSINDDSEKIASYMHLARFYKNNNPTLSKYFAEKALQSATNVNSPDDRLEALDILIKNPTNQKAIQHYEKFSFINDSIINIRQSAKNQFSKIKYDSKIAIEKSEKLKIQKDQITYLFLAFGIITILVFFLIRSKNKRKLQKSAYETETRISKRLHDELANDVFNTMTFIETQDLQTSKNKENVLQDLDSIYNKARSISKQNSEVKTGKDFGTSLNQLLMSYNSKQANIIVKGSTLIDWEKVKDTKQIEIYRILTELLVNMKKHSQADLVLISFETSEKTIKIKYSDNGKGFEKEKIIKNGLQNVENRIHAINGSITFDSETNKGLKINIEFPK
jgi:signal transduction histidine kinase